MTLVAGAYRAALADRKLLVSVVLNVVLTVLLCSVGLYAFMIKVDMEEQKGQLIRNADERKKMDAFLVAAQNDLVEARREAESLRAQLNAQALGGQMPDSAKAPLPVDVSFRRSFWGRGLVARFRNKSSHSLTLILAIRNPTLSKSSRFLLKIGPEDSKEFSYSEGWEFASGDEIHVYHNDFKALKVSVP